MSDINETPRMKLMSPIRESRDPAIACLRVRENTLESGLYIEARTRGTREEDFAKLLLHIARDDVCPIDAILRRVVRWLISKACLHIDRNE